MSILLKRTIRKIVDYAFGEYAYIDEHSKIGKYTFVGKGSAVTRAVIGNYCSISQAVYIGPGEHPMDFGSTSAELFGENVYETLTRDDVVIGHDVWIGVRAVVLRGVSIGTGAVVGAGAIVTKDVPPYAVVAGVPARVLRYRFSSDQIAELLNSKWWELDVEAAKAKLASYGFRDTLMEKR